MLILASQSPRRADLLKQIGVNFTQRSVDIDETPTINERPLAYVQRMAMEKSRLAWQQGEQSDWVLGADTIVIAEGTILGKPIDKPDCKRMLNMLSNTTHSVVTAVAVTSAGKHKLIAVETEVSFGPLTNSQIDWYWQTGEPQDKAGSYGIQGLGGQFVKHINGSYSAVVGLPLYQTKELLTEFGQHNEC